MTRYYRNWITYKQARGCDICYPNRRRCKPKPHRCDNVCCEFMRYYLKKMSDCGRGPWDCSRPYDCGRGACDCGKPYGHGPYDHRR